MCGTDNKNIRQRLLCNNELTLQVAINDVRAAETSKTKTEVLTNPAIEAAAVNVNSKNKKPKQPRDPPPKQLRDLPPKTDPKQNNKTCGRCGFCHQPRECKAYGQTCKKCQGKIILPTCLTKNPNSENRKLHEVEQQSDTDTDTDEDLFLGEVGSSQNDKNELFTDLNVNDEDIRFKVDTGAQCNVIPEHAFEKLMRKPSLQSTRVRLMAYGGIRVPIKGTCTMKIKQNGKAIDTKFFIVAVGKAQPLIGLQTCQELGLISINNNVSEVNAKETDILNEY